MNGITKGTFKEADTDTKMDILFDYLYETRKEIREINEKMGNHPIDCEKRFKTLELNSNKIDPFIYKIMGGIAALVFIITISSPYLIKIIFG